MLRRVAMRTVAIAIVLAVVASATVAAGAAGTSPPGVTANSIKVGFVTPDTSALPAGFKVPDTGDAVAQAKAFVADINAHGGINGRTVALSSYKFNLTDGFTDMRAKCLQATEDDKVFAVITPSMFGDPILCVTRQHKTPMILAGGTTQELVDKSNGLLYLTNFTTEHAIQASVDPLVKAKALKGKKLAVILEDTPGFDTAIENGLVKPLAKHGISISDKVTVTLTAEGIGALPAAVQRLKNEGVDGIFVAISAIVAPLFMQAAVKADYHPKYFTSDLSEGSSNFLPENAPSGQLNGALGTTWRRTGSSTIGEPPDAYDQKCIDTYTARSGEPAPKWGSELYQAVAGTCGLFDVFQQAATAAGKDLTVPSFTKALQGLNDFQLGYGSKGSFGAKKFDAPDQVRMVKYRPSCNCWVPSGPFQPAKL